MPVKKLSLDTQLQVKNLGVLKANMQMVLSTFIAESQRRNLPTGALETFMKVYTGRVEEWIQQAILDDVNAGSDK